jgi:hypothetical protein
MAHRDHLYDRPTGRDDGLEPRLELDAIPPLPAEDAPDVLGLAHTFPRPGWVVLDAIRERGLTGEVVCRTTPKMTVWADRGRVYHAEREDDPPLGDRLVAGRALTPTAPSASARASTSRSCSNACPRSTATPCSSPTRR